MIIQRPALDDAWSLEQRVADLSIADYLRI